MYVFLYIYIHIYVSSKYNFKLNFLQYVIDVELLKCTHTMRAVECAFVHPVHCCVCVCMCVCVCL